MSTNAVFKRFGLKQAIFENGNRTSGVRVTNGQNIEYRIRGMEEETEKEGGAAAAMACAPCDRRRYCHLASEQVHLDLGTIEKTGLNGILWGIPKVPTPLGPQFYPLSLGNKQTFQFFNPGIA